MESRLLLRQRDFLVLVLVLLGLYLSLDNKEFSYRIEPSWFVDLRDTVSNQDWKVAPSDTFIYST